MRRRWLRSRLGYGNNQMGIMRRFLREGENWEPHLSATRNAILSAVERLKPNTIAVLGSGWLLDVPMAQLLEMNLGRIALYDIEHPARIKHKFSTRKGVEFIDYDLTRGSIDALLDFIEKPTLLAAGSMAERMGKGPIGPLDQFDLVVSVNTLSQLHIPLIEALEQKRLTNRVPLAEMIVAIQNGHLESLPKGRSLLITDYEEEHCSNDGKLLSVKPRLQVSLKRWKRIAHWQWNFDTHGAYLDDLVVKMNVAAYRG